MLVKLGVDIRPLKRDIRRALNTVEYVYLAVAKTEAVITSTVEGTHSPGSLHYAGQAIDVRLPPKRYVSKIVNQLKQKLGDDYDVVLESTHIHIEYDPKKQEA